VLERRQPVAACGERARLLLADGDGEPCARVIQDIGHAVRRFIEVDGNADGAEAEDGEVRDVPFGAVRGKQADTVARPRAERQESLGQAGDAAEQLGGRDRLPAAFGTIKQRSRIREAVQRFEKAFCQRRVGHTARRPL
jgi:hypothetical protein